MSHYAEAAAMLDRYDEVVRGMEDEKAVAQAMGLIVAMSRAQVEATLAVADALHQLAPL